MLVDSHLHLSNEGYDIDKILQDAKDNNVKLFITGGTNKENNLSDIEFSKKYQEVYITLGYHPEYADIITKEDLDLLEKQIKDNIDKVAGIGEIGLDYHYGKDSKDNQIKLFKYQIQLANKYNLPVIIHSRDATLDTFNILKETEAKGVIHCFSGSVETAKEYIKLGFKLGIGGVVTFKNSNLSDVIKEIDIKDIVLETDSPYLSPIRGIKNEPKNIKIIANYICELKNINILTLEQTLLETIKKTYNVKI